MKRAFKMKLAFRKWANNVVQENLKGYQIISKVKKTLSNYTSENFNVF